MKWTINKRRFKQKLAVIVIGVAGFLLGVSLGMVVFSIALFELAIGPTLERK